MIESKKGDKGLECFEGFWEDAKLKLEGKLARLASYIEKLALVQNSWWWFELTFQSFSVPDLFLFTSVQLWQEFTESLGLSGTLRLFTSL